MNSFLITFIPVTESDRGMPLKLVQRMARSMSKTKRLSSQWRFHNQRDVSVGDRAFLLMQGKRGPSIFGYGRVGREGGLGLRKIQFEALVDPVEEVYADSRDLSSIRGASAWWRTQSSGVCLPKRIAGELERLVIGKKPTKTGLAGFNPSANATLEAHEGHHVTRSYLAKVRNRSLVESKKNQVWIRTGRLDCEVCSFDFLAFYGDMGIAVIECHHTKPVKNMRRESKTHIDDLALLCANCHRILHKGGLTVLKLKALLKKTKSVAPKARLASPR